MKLEFLLDNAHRALSIPWGHVDDVLSDAADTRGFNAFIMRRFNHKDDGPEAYQALVEGVRLRMPKMVLTKWFQAWGYDNASKKHYLLCS